MQENTVVVYGATWCGDCRRAKRLLDSHAIGYRDAGQCAALQGGGEGPRVPLT